MLPEWAAEASGRIDPTNSDGDGEQWHQAGGGLHKGGHVAWVSLACIAAATEVCYEPGLSNASSEAMDPQSPRGWRCIGETPKYTVTSHTSKQFGTFGYWFIWLLSFRAWLSSPLESYRDIWRAGLDYQALLIIKLCEIFDWYSSHLIMSFTKLLLTNQTNQTKATESAHMTTTSSASFLLPTSCPP